MWSYLSDYAQQYYTELLVHADTLWMNFKNASTTWEEVKPSQKKYLRICKYPQLNQVEQMWLSLTIQVFFPWLLLSIKG